MTQRDRAPAHLSEGRRALWRSIVADFSLRPEELALLDLALAAMDRAREAGRRVEEEGITIAGLHGQVIHPCVSVERSSSLTAARLLRQLGLSDADVVTSRPEVFRSA